MRLLSANIVKVKILLFRVHLLCMMFSLFSYRLLHVSVLYCTVLFCHVYVIVRPNIVIHSNVFIVLL